MNQPTGTIIDAAFVAIDLLKKAEDPVYLIKRDTAYVIPLQMLYAELIKDKELIPISDLDLSRKVRIWNEVKEIQRPKFVQLWTAQVLYLWEEISSGRIK